MRRLERSPHPDVAVPAVTGQVAFQRAADSMPHFVWTCKPDGTVEYFNRRWLDYTAFSVQASRRRGVKGIVHPNERAETVARWRRALRTGEPYEIEHRLRRARDGTYRWFLSRAVPQFDDAGTLTGWIGTATDIDDQRRARDNLAFVVEAGNVLLAAAGTQTICEQLANLAIKQFADWCFVTLVDGHDLSTVAMAHREAGRVRYLEQFRDRYPPRREGPVGQVIATNGPLLIERVSPEQLAESAQDAEHMRLLQTLAMHSVMLVPLSAGSGRVLGCVTLVSAESGRVFSQDDVEAASIVARRAAAAVQNVQMFDEEKRRSQRLRFIAKASRFLFESTDFKDTFSRVAELIVSEAADLCVVVRIEGEALRIEAISHRKAEMQPIVERLRGQRIFQPEAERRLIARIARNQPDLREHIESAQLGRAFWPHVLSDVLALRMISYLGVPLHSRGTTYGALYSVYGESGRTYEEADLPAFMEIAQRASIAIDNAATLQRERRIATTFQQALLPSLTPRPPGLRFDVVYASAGDEADVGGDWYDAVELDDGSVVVSVGDVTGQGLEAAVIMSKVRHALAAVPLYESDPARILDAADWILRKRFPNAIVTAFIGMISADRSTLRFASAGHPFPLLRRPGAATELRSSGLPLGLRSLQPPERSETIRLQDGDLLVLYTDGLTESDRDIVRGEQRLHDVVLSDAMTHTDRPAQLIEAACIPGRQRDDVAILTVAVGAADRWSFRAENARAAAHARRDLVAYLRQRGAREDVVEAMELVFGELISNVVCHAPGPVEVALEWSDGTPEVHVIDCGPPFTARTDLPPDRLGEGGRGLYIVSQMGADVTVERIPGYGNHVRATLRRSAE